jgi:type IV pilus assembly protein PilC
MPHYAYRAADGQGLIRKGEGSADNENSLYAQLQQRGLSLVHCREKTRSAAGMPRAMLPLQEQALLCRHVLALLKAGVPVLPALQDIRPSLQPRLGGAIEQVTNGLMKGESLSATFTAQERYFDPLFITLLSAGERTGKLTEALGFLYESLQWKGEYREKLTRTLSYPIVQMILASIAVVVLMTMAVPRIMELLATMGGQLPWYSTLLLVLMKVAGILFCLTAATTLLFMTFYPLLRLHQDIAIFCDTWLLRLPVIGKLIKKLVLAELTQVLAAMLGSGMAMMEALVVLPSFTGNRAMAHDLLQVRQRVAGGQPLSQAMTRHMLIPAYVVRLLKVGEDGGNMTESLRHISSVYQQESQEELEHLLKIISLFITITVGLVLISMVVGVMLPLYRGLSQMVAG